MVESLDKFFELLNQVKYNYTWAVEEWGDIRGDTENGDYVCPVTAIINSLYHQEFDPSDYTQANQEYLHLSEELIAAITDAADLENLNFPEVKRIRVRMLDILGLEENTDA